MIISLFLEDGVFSKCNYLFVPLQLKHLCLTAVSGVGSSPALATCETSQVLLADVSGGFPGVLPFRPTYIDWPVSMSEIILKGTLN